MFYCANTSAILRRSAMALAATALGFALHGSAHAHFCGDGETNQASEQCDPPDDRACPGMCSFECRCAVCGDLVLDAPVEDCDGANALMCPGQCQPDCRCPQCGDSVREGSEGCDGADDAACPGACSAACACAVCGDGIADAPIEDCDADDTDECPGKCLSDCRCPVCGDGVTEGAETCDGSDDDACPGLCAGDCRCPSPCAAMPAPAASCRQAGLGRALLQYRRDENGLKNRLGWKWVKGGATSASEFLDPVDDAVATYHLCVYDASGGTQPVIESATAAQGVCDGKPCWRRLGSAGFRYKDRAAMHDGAKAIKLKGGGEGRARVQWIASGPRLGAPMLFFTVPVTAQLLISDGFSTNCWQTVYSEVLKNGSGRFKAKGP